MTPHKQTVQAFLDGLRRGDPERLLGCVTDDVEWELPPYFSLTGSRAVTEAVRDGAPPPAEIHLVRLIEEGHIVVAEGTLRAARTPAAGGQIDALFCTVFHFHGDRIGRVITYQVDGLARVDTCPCGHSSHRRPQSRAEALALGRHQNAIQPLLDNVVTSREKWMSVLRCRRCGRLWAEDSISSGQMDLFFVYPIATEDPEAWLDAAQPLSV